MLIQNLIEIGLGEKESQAYLTLLQYGCRPVDFIAKKSGLNRGTAYQALHSLLEQGLAVKSIKKKVQVFCPLDPERLYDYLERKRQEQEKRKAKVLALIASMQLKSSLKSSRPSIKYFDGQDGVRRAYEDTLTAKDRTLLAYFSVRDMDRFLGAEYLKEYTVKRIQAGYKLKVIQTYENSKEALARKSFADIYGTSKAARREARYLKDELTFPVTLYTYDDKVLIISSVSENFALIITSQEFADMQKKIFMHLWQRLPGGA